MIHIGMLTPDRFPIERSNSLKLNFSLSLSVSVVLGQSLFEINRRVIVSPFHDDNDELPQTKRFIPADNPPPSAEKKPKAWSVRARRDVPNLLRGDR